MDLVACAGGEAFELGLFRGLLTTTDVAAAWANLQSDLRSGRLVRATVKWPAVFRRAVRLSEQHSATTGTRSLDVLHVAAAKSLGAVEFISLDDRQRALAKDTVLVVAP